VRVGAPPPVPAVRTVVPVPHLDKRARWIAFHPFCILRCTEYTTVRTFIFSCGAFITPSIFDVLQNCCDIGSERCCGEQFRLDYRWGPPRLEIFSLSAILFYPDGPDREQ
jgi:hypothetical protein